MYNSKAQPGITFPLDIEHVTVLTTELTADGEFIIRYRSGLSGAY